MVHVLRENTVVGYFVTVFASSLASFLWGHVLLKFLYTFDDYLALTLSSVLVTIVALVILYFVFGRDFI